MAVPRSSEIALGGSIEDDGLTGASGSLPAEVCSSLSGRARLSKLILNSPEVDCQQPFRSSGFGIFNTTARCTAEFQMVCVLFTGSQAPPVTQEGFFPETLGNVTDIIVRPCDSSASTSDGRYVNTVPSASSFMSISRNSTVYGWCCDGSALHVFAGGMTSN